MNWAIMKSPSSNELAMLDLMKEFNSLKNFLKMPTSIVSFALKTEKGFQFSQSASN